MTHQFGHFDLIIVFITNRFAVVKPTKLNIIQENRNQISDANRTVSEKYPHIKFSFTFDCEPMLKG